MANEFVYAQPVKIWFGEGKFRELSAILEELGVTRAVLVCGRHFAPEAAAMAEADGRFAAGFRGEDLFRVEWDAMNGFTDAIVLRLGEGEGGAPALRAERLRTTPRTHFAMDSATIPLARADGGPALRTARCSTAPRPKRSVC